MSRMRDVMSRMQKTSKNVKICNTGLWNTWGCLDQIFYLILGKKNTFDKKPRESRVWYKEFGKESDVPN